MSFPPPPPPPTPTPDEARASLAEIEHIANRIRKSVAAGQQATLLIFWGIIWAVGFTITQLYPAGGGWTWLGLISLGVVVSLFLGGWHRSFGSRGGAHGRIGISWLLLIAYAWLESSLLNPWTAHRPHQPLFAFYGYRRLAFWCCAVMFGYVIMGLWLSRFLLWLGLFVTVAACAGLLLAVPWYGIWMAFFCGGALIAAGLYIRLAWR